MRPWNSPTLTASPADLKLHALARHRRGKSWWSSLPDARRAGSRSRMEAARWMWATVNSPALAASPLDHRIENEAVVALQLVAGIIA